jgi:ketosteroid isomerase-like protein
MPISLEGVDAQETRFAAAFAAGDISLARPLYHPDVVYSSPTTRLFGWPRRVDGVERTLEFIQLTISGCRDIAYRCDERAVLPDDAGAYTRIHFDWDAGGTRLRSTYVVVYRYALDGRIIGQELYYDPSDELERLG